MAQGPGNSIHSPEDIVNDYPAAELSEKQIADLELGKELEIKDIADLEEVMIAAPEDFKAVYANLKAGSENHLAAFDKVSNNERGSRGSQRAKNNQSGSRNMNRNNNRPKSRWK